MEAVVTKMRKEKNFVKIQNAAKTEEDLKGEIYFYIVGILREMYPSQKPANDQIQADPPKDSETTESYRVYTAFSNKLKMWYPAQKKFNEKFLQYLENKTISNEAFVQKINNLKKDQLKDLDELKDFAKLNPSAVNEAVSISIGEYLRNKTIGYKLSTDLRNHLKESQTIFTLDNLLNNERLNSHIDDILKQLQLNELKINLKIWYPEQTNLNEMFINFLRAKQLESNAIDRMRHNQTEFEYFLQDFGMDFTTANKQVLKEEMLVQIFEIVNEDKTMGVPRKHHVYESFKNSSLLDNNVKLIYVYNKEKLRLYLRPLIDKIVTDVNYSDAYKNLKKQLKAWFPHGRNFTEQFVPFLRSKQVQLKNLIDLSKSKEAMFSEENILFAEFISSNKNAFNQLVYGEVKIFLKEIDANKVEENLEKLRANNFDESFKPNLLINSSDLKQLTRDKLNYIWTSEAFQNIEYYLNIWFPNSTEFISAFTNHLKSKGVKLDTLQSLTKNRNEMFSEGKVQISYFISHNKEVFNALVYKEVGRILRILDASRVEEKLDKLKRNKFQTKFSSESLINRSQFQRLIENEVETINYNECKKGLKARMSNLVTTEPSEVQKSLQDNKCIEEEICNRKSEFNEKYLQEELTLYIEPLKRNDRSKNENIKDEIDDSIYETIKSTLKDDKKLSDAKIECIVSFIYRKNLIDRVYTTELLFDPEKLMTHIKPMVQEYEKFYANKSAPSINSSDDDYET